MNGPDWRLTPTELAGMARDARRYAHDRYIELAERVAALENGPDPLAAYRNRKTREGRGRHRGDVATWATRRRARRLARLARRMHGVRSRVRRTGRVAYGIAALPYRVATTLPALALTVAGLLVAGLLFAPQQTLRVLPGSQMCAGLAGPAGTYTVAWGAGRWLDRLEDAEPLTVGQASDGIMWAARFVRGTVDQLLAGLRGRPAPAGTFPRDDPSTLTTAAASCACPGDSPVRQASKSDGVQIVPAAVNTPTGPDAIAAALVRAGATDLEAVRLTAISGDESQFGQDPINATSTARGPFQILLSAHPSMSEQDALDLDRSAVYALRLAREDGGKGIERHWRATFTSSQRHYAVAQAAVAKARGVALTSAPASDCTPASLTAPAGTTVPVLPQQPFITDDPGRCQTPTRTYPNGQLPSTALCPLVSAPGHQLRADAAAAWDALIATVPPMLRRPTVTDSYRDLAGQLSVRAQKPGLAAVPGTSKHGLGIALDLGGGAQICGTPIDRWLQENGPAYGWARPGWAQPWGSKEECWHTEFTGVPNGRSA